MGTDWTTWSMHVLKALERYGDDIEKLKKHAEIRELKEEIGQLKTKIALLKQKVAMYAALISAVTGIVVSIIMALIIQWLTK